MGRLLLVPVLALSAITVQAYPIYTHHETERQEIIDMQIRIAELMSMIDVCYSRFDGLYQDWQVAIAENAQIQQVPVEDRNALWLAIASANASLINDLEAQMKLMYEAIAQAYDEIYGLDFVIASKQAEIDACPICGN